LAITHHPDFYTSLFNIAMENPLSSGIKVGFNGINVGLPSGNLLQLAIEDSGFTH
jgi:hypothetical protein